MYSIRHYIIMYIDMLIINYDYRIYVFNIGKMVVYREHIPDHQMRHKSQIQKLRFWNNMIEDNTSFIMVKELCFYHN